MLTKQYLGRLAFTDDLLAKTAVTAAPTSASDGVAITAPPSSPTNHRSDDTAIAAIPVVIGVEFTRASGDGTCTIWVYGYDDTTWYRLEALDQMAETGADMNHAIRLEIGSMFTRIATRVAEISGTTATVVATRVGVVA